MEKILKKILLLNKSLKDTKSEIKKLENEENTFSDAINESRQNTLSQNNKDNKEKVNNSKYYNGKSNDILKKYEEDLKFLNELMNENDQNIDEI